ncbi:putative sphingosine-1-phosphate phosphatase [Trypanosoma conorhini]|uniref:Putative sphingosine-1-phosphate phosphatase n=1 Tax=Trypanosoma conorhini TaxID=83891 RepID=A0A422QBL8_9TRYP|nr:putative sphingosine-1-phosphate phosphatase [Trypanosoma conorhini]RNF27315.1 putative sphingosine-1-phosphate phosphatase [Trypanosoma conorhini]
MNEDTAVAVQPRINGLLASSPPASHLHCCTFPIEQQPVVPFRSWYASNYCNEEHLSVLLRLQRCFPSLQRAITIYFNVWSCTGETEFYTAFFPTMAWLGLWPEVLDMAVLMCLSQYITGTLKDAAGCPRPPCPPVELRGRANASKEYGYPSTHASHSLLFSYSVYPFLIRLFPNHPVACVVACIVFAVNVSFSRLFLGMHWPADMVAGFGLAGLILVSHAAFLRSWVLTIASLATVEVWHYMLALLVVQVLAVSHAAPREFCPCYLDSLRFLGAALGALFGGWAFYSQYGTYTARTPPADLCGTLLSWEFLLQYICCFFVLVLGKTITSFVATPLLRWFFSSVSRRAAPSRPWLWRRVRAALSDAVRRAYWIPLCEGPAAGAAQQQQRKPTPTADAACLPGCAGSSVEVLLPRTCDEDAAPRDPVQMWSPRTHGHWWLWEAHRCTVAYFAVGFMIMYVCPVILRVCFRVS